MTEQPGQSETLAQDRRRGERGFGIVQIVITLAIAGIISTFAIMKITYARDSMRLAGSARLFGSWVEKARLDAIRRHATSSVQFLNTTTYRVTMDFDGRGVIGSRDITFDQGVSLLSAAPPTLSFDWRGRVSNCTLTFAMQNNSGDQTSVDVTGSGDVTVDNEVGDLPTITYTNVNKTSDILTESTVTGSTAVTTTTTDCSSTTSSGSITGTGTTPLGTSCTFTANPAALTVKKSGGSTGTVIVTQTAGTSGSLTVSAPSNLRVQASVSTPTILGTGSVTYSVTSLNSTRGTFNVVFTSPCTSVTVSVKVVR